MRRLRNIAWLIVALGLAPPLLAAPATGRKAPTPAQGAELWRITQGGQLYDNWGLVLGVPYPAETHPAYPPEGRQRGGQTWRCVECHGWDYRGHTGQYRLGEHRTGIKGIRALAGQPRARIERILRGPRHRFGRDLINDEGVRLLAEFIRSGQFNMDAYVDRQTGLVRGDPVRGQALFERVCVRCHGADGRAQNFGTDSEPVYLGAEARAEPWKVMHKARFGQPGTGMLSYGEFFERLAENILIAPRDIADVVAYAQTLPEK